MLVCLWQAHFTKIDLVHEACESYCHSVGDPERRRLKLKPRVATYFWFVLLPTINRSQTVQIWTVVEATAIIASTALINARNSANDFSVKLSRAYYTASYISCPGWKKGLHM